MADLNEVLEHSMSDFIEGVGRQADELERDREIRAEAELHALDPSPVRPGLGEAYMVTEDGIRVAGKPMDPAVFGRGSGAEGGMEMPFGRRAGGDAGESAEAAHEGKSDVATGLDGGFKMFDASETVGDHRMDPVVLSIKCEGEFGSAILGKGAAAAALADAHPGSDGPDTVGSLRSTFKEAREPEAGRSLSDSYEMA